jgi:putative membrane protein
MLWLKAFHIFFVIAWFAGLFYLPRLFVYHASTSDEPGLARFRVMEQRLFRLMTLGGTLAIAFGIGILIVAPAFARTGWMHAKLALVIALVGYHVWCYRLVRAFRESRNTHSERWYRAFNEVPTLLLLAIVLLVVLKPF